MKYNSKKKIYRKHGVEYRISREGGVYIIPLITVFFLFLIFYLLRKIMQTLFFFLPTQPNQNSIGPSIRIGREILCIPYAGFLIEAIPYKK